MILLENKTGIPLDVVIYINGFMHYEKLSDENFKEAIELWFRNQSECKLRFGSIGYWNTSRVTDMKKSFYDRRLFNRH
jgi:hypothetical protein